MQPFPTSAPPQRHAAAVASPPQYADFEMNKKGGDDLPQMPSWEGAGAKKVMLEEEQGVEMDQLKSTNQQDPRFGRAGTPGSGPVSPMSADGRNPYGNHSSQGSYMGPAAAAGAAGAAYAAGRRPMSPYTARNQQYPNQQYPNQAPGNQGYGQPLSPTNPAYNMGNTGNQGHNQHGYNQGRDQMLNPPNDYNSNRISDGYGLDQPYEQSSGNPLAATAAAAGLTGAAGAALAAGAANRGSPSPGPHGYGQPRQASAGHAYAEMPAGPKPFGEVSDNQNQTQNSRQYAEMAAEPRGSDRNVHAAFAEMSADGQPHTSPSDKNQNNTHCFEMPTDQVAPIELDSGYVPPIQTSHAAQIKEQPASQSRTAQSPQRGPQGHGMQRRGTGDAPYDPYSQQRQVSADRNNPQGYGMKRRGTGDSQGAGSPAPHGMDPRMRPSPSPITPGAGPRSPGPRSPGPRSPGPRNSPGPRRPVPRGDQPFAPSPLSTPVPQNESAYSRPAYNNQPYPSSPRAQRSPDHNVPVSRPTQQTAFAEPQPHSPITNNGGFDFTSGFSRPQDSFDRRPSESREPASREGYPGYKPYTQQPQGGWNGV